MSYLVIPMHIENKLPSIPEMIASGCDINVTACWISFKSHLSMVLTKVKPTHPLLILQAFSQSSVDVLPYTIQDWWVEICPDESSHPAPMVITNFPKFLVIVIYYYHCIFLFRKFWRSEEDNTSNEYLYIIPKAYVPLWPIWQQWTRKLWPKLDEQSLAVSHIRPAWHWSLEKQPPWFSEQVLHEQ